MRRFLVPAFLVMGMLSGCASSSRGPYSGNSTQRRDIRKAEAIYQKGVQQVAEDSAKAEKLFREALGFDLYHGPAHNNLGVLLLEQGKLYDAAEEFEWARKLMPGNPEPRVNLSIVLDQGGKHRDALDAARSALEVSPGDLAAMQAMALIQVRESMLDEQTLVYLDGIIQRSDDRLWVEWAREQRIRIPEAQRQN
jgi:Tfp pilus assembly protein PilF